MPKGVVDFFPRSAWVDLCQLAQDDGPLQQRHRSRDFQDCMVVVIEIGRSDRKLLETSFRLGPCLEQVQDAVSKAGGDIIHFARSMVCVWHDAPPSSPRAELALQCANNLKGKLVREDTKNPMLKIGVGQGGLRIMYLGGIDSRMVHCLYGDAVDQANGAVSLASTGEVFLSHAVWDWAETICRALSMGGDAADGVKEYFQLLGFITEQPWTKRGELPSIEKASEEVLESMEKMIPVPAVPFLADNIVSVAWAAGERPVTAISFRFVIGSEEEDEDWHLHDLLDMKQLQAAVLGIQKITAQYEGSLVDFCHSEGYCAASVIFGLAPQAHENDAMRACLCSLAMCNLLDSLKLRCCMGVASGNALCVPLGRPGVRREYFVIGKPMFDAVAFVDAFYNLEKLGRGRVPGAHAYIDQGTRDQLAEQDRSKFLSLHPEPNSSAFLCEHNFYGKAQNDMKSPRASGLFKADLPSVLTRTHYVLKKISSRLFSDETSLDWKSRPITVSCEVICGDNGSGKSLLLTDFIKDLVRRFGARILALPKGDDTVRELALMPKPMIDRPPPCVIRAGGTFVHDESYPGAFLWRTVVRALVEPAKMSPFKQSAPELSQEWGDLLNIRSQKGWQADATYDKVWGLLCWYLERNPLVLVFDDCQWMTASDWALSIAILTRYSQSDTNTSPQDEVESKEPSLEAPERYPLVILKATHDLKNMKNSPTLGTITNGYLEFLQEEFCEVRNLHSFNRREVEFCLEQVVQDSQIPPYFVSIVHMMTGGNPKFIVEFLSFLKEQGQLHPLLAQCASPAPVSRSKSRPDTPQKPRVDQLSVPPTVENVLLGFMDRLTVNQVLLLKCASTICTSGGVVSVVFDLGFLIRVFQRAGVVSKKESTIGHINEMLDELIHFGLVSAQTPLHPDPDTTITMELFEGPPERVLVPREDSEQVTHGRQFRLSSGFVRDTCYNQMLAAHKHHMHTTTTLELEELFRKASSTVVMEPYQIAAFAKHLMHHYEAIISLDSSVAKGHQPLCVTQLKTSEIYKFKDAAQRVLSVNRFKNIKRDSGAGIGADEPPSPEPVKSAKMEEREPLKSLDDRTAESVSRSSPKSQHRTGWLCGCGNSTVTPAMGADSQSNHRPPPSPAMLRLGAKQQETVRNYLSNEDMQKRADGLQIVLLDMPPTALPLADPTIKEESFEFRYDHVSLRDETTRDQLTRILEEVDSWDFDIFELLSVDKTPLFHLGQLVFMKRSLLRKSTMCVRTSGIVRPRIWANFLREIEAGYNALPYHNSLHAADVFQSIHVLLQLREISEITELEAFSLLVAAAIVDYKHPGFNNQFLVASKSDLFPKYEDERCLLEEFHIAETWKLIEGNRQCDIFADLGRADKQRVKHFIKRLVLDTSLVGHFDFIDKFEKKWKSGLNLAEAEPRQEVCTLLLKCADISNSGKSFDNYMRWVHRSMEEFFRQGDSEKEKGLSVSRFMDRASPAVHRCQSGFIKLIVSPIFDMLGRALPSSRDKFRSHLIHNLTFWENEMKEAEEAAKEDDDASSEDEEDNGVDHNKALDVFEQIEASMNPAGDAVKATGAGDKDPAGPQITLGMFLAALEEKYPDHGFGQELELNKLKFFRDLHLNPEATVTREQILRGWNISFGAGTVDAFGKVSNASADRGAEALDRATDTIDLLTSRRQSKMDPGRRRSSASIAPLSVANVGGGINPEYDALFGEIDENTEGESHEYKMAELPTMEDIRAAAKGDGAGALEEMAKLGI